jgi:hypothetical protein
MSESGAATNRLMPLQKRDKDLSDRVGKLMLLAYIVLFFLFLILPLGALIIKSLQNADGEFIGLHNFYVYLREPALFQSFFQLSFYCHSLDNNHRRTRVWFCVCPYPHPDAVQRIFSTYCLNSASQPIYFSGHRAGLLVWQSGRFKGIAVRIFHLWSDRDCHGLSLLDISACSDDFEHLVVVV